jgi:threonine/homoserine/homoserine lactone efflux protein
MGQAISEMLPFAVGVAISPIPIIAVILVLFSSRARVNGPAFLAGWVVGVAVVSIAVYLVADAGDASTDQTTSDTVSWVKLVLGLFLVAHAVRSWRGHGGGEHPEPEWMASIDALTPVKAAGLGALLSGLNPKNLALSLAAGASLAQIGATGAEATVGLVVFIVVASLSIAVPVVFYLVGGARAASVMEGWKAWLSTHNQAVMAVLFLVFGVVLFSQGLRGLTA